MFDIKDHIDHQRWLIDNGFINDLHKDSVYLYGTLVHPDVKAVQCTVSVETKIVDYTLYLNKKTLSAYFKFHELSQSNSIIGLWRFKNLIKTQGDMNFQKVLTGFISDYLGPKWKISVTVKDFDSYEEGFKDTEQGSGATD
jgi:hypothetical protein